MIKFEKIYIKGFKSSNRNLELTFSEEMISVIYGENGNGKTTFLKIIHALLSKDEKILYNEKVREVTIWYKDGLNNHKVKVTLITEDENYFTFDLEKQKRKGNIHRHGLQKISDYDLGSRIESITYDWREFDQSSLSDASSILFGVNRGTPKKFQIDEVDIVNFITNDLNYRELFKSPRRARDFSEELAQYLFSSQQRRRIRNQTNRNLINNASKKNAHIDDINVDTIQEIILKRYNTAKRVSSERVQKALFDTLSYAIRPEREQRDFDYREDNNFIEELSKNREKLFEALSNATENRLRNEILRILQIDDPEKIMAFCADSELLSDLLYRMIIELRNEEYVLESISTLEEIFNSHLSNNKKIKINNDEIYIEVNSDKHNLNELSSGERHLLTFLTIFLIEGANRDFLVIDEPELSLNIKWQREILPLLHRLTPNSQIIVASHSPSIAKKNTNYLVQLNPQEVNIDEA
ncbi:AAA family ATPase [Exiguobacterium sp. NG55]|uniref:AAA family ATPase n=1 Tax=Exiguobacterium sp. NG55 TaxID=375477 RepID=UPI0004DF7CB4|nr:AAA family ATPase [Exiguobacterium sp. NG55]